MAELVINIKPDEVTNTIKFRGKEYTEIWEDDYTFCEYSTYSKFIEDYPEWESDTMEYLFDQITREDLQVAYDAIQELTEIELGDQDVVQKEASSYRSMAVGRGVFRGL